MRPGAPHPVPHHEMITPSHSDRADRQIFLSGGTRGSQVHPQLEEGVVAHSRPPQPEIGTRGAGEPAPRNANAAGADQNADPSQRPKAHLIARNLAIKWFLSDRVPKFLSTLTANTCG